MINPRPLNYILIALLLSTVQCTTSHHARSPSNDMDSQACMQVNYPRDDFENGFVILDVLKETKLNHTTTLQPLMCRQDLEKTKSLKLQAYNPLFNFVESKQTLQKKANYRAQHQIKEEPWVGQGLDVTNIEDAEKVAEILQRYVYEGWFDADQTPDKTDYEKHFRENNARTWCQTPWLNVTEKGREAIHGLTKEFPIRTTHVYEVPKDIEKNEDAVSWGVAYFNDKVCAKYQNFFKEKGSMIPQIQNMQPNFETPDGGVAFKLLFSAMPDWRDNMKRQWTSGAGNQEAYNWWAHVSHARQDDGKTPKDESIRQLMNVAHVQMDISLRDSRLKGTIPLLKNWIMTTYYYDPNYTNKALVDMKIPEALKHMRPVGLQFGLDAGQSHIFPGAKNNHIPPDYAKAPLNADLPPELDHLKTRLNGPVDNIQSSCLGCHAAAGMRFNAGLMRRTIKNPPMTFMSNQQYADYRKTLASGGTAGDFDFNMQLDKAMRNFVNRNRPKNEKMEEAQK